MTYVFRTQAALALVALASLLAQPASAGVRWRGNLSYDALPQRPAELQQRLKHLLRRASPQHVLVRLPRIATESLRERLATRGLRILTYVGDACYFATLHPDAAVAQLSTEGDLLAVSVIQVAWKLHPWLRDGRCPGWAIVDRSDPDRVVIGAYVLFHPDVGPDDQLRACRRHGAVVCAKLMSVPALVVELRRKDALLLAQEDAVQWIEPALPRFDGTNDDCRARTQANVVHDAPYGLTGAGVTVLVYDGGTADPSHVDFDGRLFVRDQSGQEAHATHVAGTIGGSGAASDGTYMGMAPAVTLESYGFEYDGSGIFLYTNPGDIEADYYDAIHTYHADIANNSIGTNIVLNGYDCDLMGNYGITAMVLDSIVCGSLGLPFRIIWANGNERQNPRTCGADYHTTGPPACAKNIITVGAVNSDDDSMTTFSSWGPTDDGRIVPTLCAPGCQGTDDHGVTSCAPGGGYATMCGTSMATPTVTGCGALFIEAWRTQYPGRPDPRNATLKAVFAQTAEDLGTPGPDYQFGYGSLRIQPAIDALLEGRIVERAVGHQETVTIQVNVSPQDSELRVTLAWDDWRGTPNVAQALVNDLDLRVSDPAGGTYYPWTLNPTVPGQAAVRTSEDHINNIEQVVVDGPLTPGTWTIEVYGYSVPISPQYFSLCLSLPVVATEPYDVLSPAYTVVNEMSVPPVYNTAASRSCTVTNEIDQPQHYASAVSRSVTLSNMSDNEYVACESRSRAYTVTNMVGLPPLYTAQASRCYTVVNMVSWPPWYVRDAMSRAVTFGPLSPGDVESDGPSEPAEAESKAPSP